jgi:hypothetical protein
MPSRIRKNQKSQMTDLLNLIEKTCFLQIIRKGINRSSGRANGSLIRSIVIAEEIGENTKNPHRIKISLELNSLG